MSAAKIANNLVLNEPGPLGPLALDDLNLCLGLRLDDDNPWLWDRIELQFRHYNPSPRIVLADLGSRPDLAARLEALAAANGGLYTRAEHSGPYSAAKAHNLAASAAESKLIFFADPDTFADETVFARIIQYLNQTGAAGQLGLMLNFPVVHLKEDASREFLSAPDSPSRSSTLARMKEAALYDIEAAADFVSPYSNIYLCRKDGFELSGGYDENFAGHGSEDFEFLLRFALLMGRCPWPADCLEDLHRPSDESFFFQRPYAGFRACFEAMSFSAELNGFMAFHLKHPVLADKPWVKNRDWNRARFNDRAAPFLRDRRALLERDWLPRKHNLLALAEGEDEAPFFPPFRLAGYRLLVPNQDASPPDVFNETPVDAVAFCGDAGVAPKSAYVRTVLELAAQRGVPVIKVEPGPYPESRFYRTADDGEVVPDEAACSFFADNPSGPIEATVRRFRMGGRSFLESEPPVRFKPRAYALSRLRLMSEKQWRQFGRNLPVTSDNDHMGPLSRLILRLERVILRRALRGRPRKLHKYERDRETFFITSKNWAARLYYRASAALIHK